MVSSPKSAVATTMMATATSGNILRPTPKICGVGRLGDDGYGWHRRSRSLHAQRVVPMSIKRCAENGDVHIQADISDCAMKAYREGEQRRCHGKKGEISMFIHKHIISFQHQLTYFFIFCF